MTLRALRLAGTTGLSLLLFVALDQGLFSRSGHRSGLAGDLFGPIGDTIVSIFAGLFLIAVILALLEAAWLCWNGVPMERGKGWVLLNYRIGIYGREGGFATLAERILAREG